METTALAPVTQKSWVIPKDLYEVDDEGVLKLDLHKGQTEAWEATERFILVTAGTQSGKTSFGPFWLQREISMKGPGDYLIVTPTFQLLDLKLLPEFRRLFEDVLQLGKYVASPRRMFVFNRNGEKALFGAPQVKRTTVFFGYAEDPDSLESATAKAAWCDEAGQAKFKLGSYRAILRRLSLAQGRILFTTTPYNLDWLYHEIFLPWHEGRAQGQIKVVNFRSIDNPQFSIAEYERARATLPRWMFQMMYDGLFVRPAGLIYDSFDRRRHLIKRFDIPSYWRRVLGIDFGAVNTVCNYYAIEPQTERAILYNTYHAGKRTAAEHKRFILGEDLPEGHPLREPRIPMVIGGNKSEHDRRLELTAAGLPVVEPNLFDVDLGIQRVYGMHKKDKVVVFSDLLDYIHEKETYSYETDANGNVKTGVIKDKSKFHHMDAERYAVGGFLVSTGTGLRSVARGGPGEDDDRGLY